MLQAKVASSSLRRPGTTTRRKEWLEVEDGQLGGMLPASLRYTYSHVHVNKRYEEE